MQDIVRTLVLLQLVLFFVNGQPSQNNDIVIGFMANYGTSKVKMPNL